MSWSGFMLRRMALIAILVLPLSSLALTRYRLADQAAPAASSVGGVGGGQGLSNGDFSKLIQRLSEPGGYFDTDNLISNEASYLHVLGKLRRMNVQQGAYLGVGPDQNFSYISQIRPQIAYIIDIRRDNLLQHLLFKGLFAQARNRVEYLALLFGKPVPSDAKAWSTRSLQQVVDYIEKTPSQRERFEAAKSAVAIHVRGLGLNLSDSDMGSIGRIHEAFFQDGLDLRFTSKNRPPRAYYPTYRDLLLEKDLTGKQSSFMGSEEDFQFVKSLEEHNLVVPVVGNLAGEHALAAIGRDATERGLRVSAFYTSNVEFYLMREGGFDRFIENVKRLPISDQSVIIRSYFSGGFGYAHPQSVPGYYSTQLLQTIGSMLREFTSGGYDSYSDLVTKHSLELK
ncbi:MAG: hypothetical protein ABI882_09040 [Acidobacteriota bacterium]